MSHTKEKNVFVLYTHALWCHYLHISSNDCNMWEDVTWTPRKNHEYTYSMNTFFQYKEYAYRPLICIVSIIGIKLCIATRIHL